MPARGPVPGELAHIAWAGSAWSRIDLTLSVITASLSHSKWEGKGTVLSKPPSVARNELLELGIFSGAMPEMQNFNCSPFLVQTIVDVERRVEKPPEMWMSLYGSADVRMIWK